MKSDGIFVALGVVVGGGVMYLLFKLMNSQAKKHAEGYIAEQVPGGEFIKAGIPPLRLWWRNRKGDRWAKIRRADGSEFWLRVRHTLLSGTKYDEFG